jgi:hypothetical protein
VDVGAMADVDRHGHARVGKLKRLLLRFTQWRPSLAARFKGRELD